MGSSEENRYLYSIDTNIDTQISFRKFPSRTLHPQISHVFQLSDLEFFRFLQHLPHFPVISILDFYLFIYFLAFLVTVPVTIPCITTYIRYRYSTILKGIDTVSIVPILFCTIMSHTQEKEHVTCPASRMYSHHACTVTQCTRSRYSTRLCCGTPSC